MLNQEVNALSMLAKRPYTSSGWRVLKSRPAGGSGSAFGIGSTDPGTDTADLSGIRPDRIGGVAENATLGGDSSFIQLSSSCHKPSIDSPRPFINIMTSRVTYYQHYNTLFYELLASAQQ